MKKKKAAEEFLQLASKGRVREVYRKYLSPKFRHHNPYFRGDAESLITAMEQNAGQNPEKVLEILHALEDGDFVSLHMRVHMKPGDRGVAVVHIYRFEGDLVAELWDIAQPMPEDSPNEYGMF